MHIKWPTLHNINIYKKNTVPNLEPDIPSFGQEQKNKNKQTKQKKTRVHQNYIYKNTSTKY